MRPIDYFDKALAGGRERTAFIDGDTTFTYGEVDELATGVARALARVGDHVRAAIYSPNDARAFVCILAIFRAGGSWVPINARNQKAANLHFLRLVACEVLFYHASMEDEALAFARDVPSLTTVVCIDRDGRDGAPSLLGYAASASSAPLPEVPDDPDRVVALFPTGGTTALSKCALWTQRVLSAMVTAYWTCLPSTTPIVHLVAGPMTHAAGGLALMMMPGAPTNVILRKADPGLILDAIDRYRVTHLYAPPTLLYMMLSHPDRGRYDYSSLQYFVLAAASVAPDKLREAREVFGPVMCQSFGQAEAPMFLTFLSAHDLGAGSNPGADRFASCGRETLNVRVEIMDEEGALLGPEMRGEIVCRGDLVIPEYLDNPVATEDARRFGWHHTGDVGYRDRQGFLYIVDRKKDMIVTGGFNVFSAEIEQVILSHPGVQECAVVGVPDEKWGEAVKAVLELKPGQTASSDDIMALVKNQLGGVHTPKSIEVWRELPRSPNGKVLKREIRDTFWAGRVRAV